MIGCHNTPPHIQMWLQQIRRVFIFYTLPQNSLSSSAIFVVLFFVIYHFIFRPSRCALKPKFYVLVLIVVLREAVQRRTRRTRRRGHWCCCNSRKTQFSKILFQSLVIFYFLILYCLPLYPFFSSHFIYFPIASFSLLSSLLPLICPSLPPALNLNVLSQCVMAFQRLSFTQRA